MTAPNPLIEQLARGYCSLFGGDWAAERPQYLAMAREFIARNGVQIEDEKDKP